MAINVGDNFSYQGKKYLDSRQSFETLQELQSYTEVPEGFIAYCEENKKRYEFIDGVWTEYIVSAEVEDDPNIATKTYVDELIESHTHEEYLTKHQDISHLATKAELNNKLDDVEINEEETTDSQTALDFFADGNKVKTVYIAKGGGSGSASAYISTTLPEEAMVETGFDFDILIDFYSPNPGKGTLKVFVNDVDVLSTPIIQGETTTTLTHDKLSKGTNRIVVYVLDRIGTMSNSLTFYVRYGSTELTGEFDSSMAYDYGANIRYYFIATALDTSLALTFYMSIDNVVQNGISCVSDVRGYFTFPNSLEAGGHYCECWVEDSNGSKSNVEQFNLVILDTNTLAIVTETRSASVEEGSQLVLDYRVYKKNETSFIIKTYVDEELVSTGTCGLTKSFYKSSTLREGMHNIKIEAWDITETISDYVTWTVIITPSTYTMVEPATAGSIFMATAKNRTNGDANREIWTGYNQDGEPIDAALFNFAFNSESGWMDDQLFITGNSHVEIPIQPLANNARYGFTLDIEFSTKPIGVEDAEVLRLWNDIDNCGIKITTEQLILQSKTGNKCELYFTEDQIVSAIFIIDRHEKTAKVYLNGVMCAAFALSDYTAEGVSYLEDFTVNDNLYLGGKNKNGYSTIKNLRIYELALSSSEILNNFISNETDKTKQQALVNFQKGEDLPTVTVYCDFSGLGKDDKKYCDIVYNSPDPVKYGESFSLMGKYSQLQYQGTSSMQYPIKNYRLNPRDANGKVKIKLPFCQPETRFTLKADFMSSGHWQNTGLTKWINENLYNYKEDDPKSMNPAKWWAIQNGKDPNDYRECIYGFPCRLILVNDGNSPLNEGQQEPTPGNTKDMGIFNFNLDKDCENSLGFKIDDFPNALSMEVTANSDTSAGAFMALPYSSDNFYLKGLEIVGGNASPIIDLETNSITFNYSNVRDYGIETNIKFDNGKQYKISVNIDIDNNSTVASKLVVIGKTGSGTLANGMGVIHSTSTSYDGRFFSKFTIPDTGEYCLYLNGNNFASGITGVTIFKDLMIEEVTANTDLTTPSPYVESTNGDKYLAYIKESFELRYPDEDDVPEGWGFMGMTSDLPRYAFDFNVNSDHRSTTIFQTSLFDSVTFITNSGGTWGINYYNSNGVWASNSDTKQSGETIVVDKQYTHMRITDHTGGASNYQTLNINGMDYLYGENLGSGNTIKEPYINGTVQGWSNEHGLKALIDWVDKSTDEQFVSEFEEHFHKDYTLRYFLLVMVLGMVDNLGKNMMLDSYDGKIWMPRFYDCDTICSYDNSGAIKFDVDIEMAQGYWNTSSSRLWTRVRDLFHDELVAKYNDMRQNGMSYESFMNVFYNEQIAKIPQKYYNMDADVKYLPYADEYLGKAHGDGYEHLKRWLKNRLIFTDSLYDYAPSYTNDMITFRANTTEEMSITIETYTPVYQHVSWYNGNVQKEKIAKGTRLTFKGFAQAATDQEVLVYGGSNIKRIIGISTMNPNSMLIGNASRLVELDISDCPILTDINSNKANFTPHTYLNKLDISNCPRLGGSLRLNYSPLIQEINAMNTSVTDLQLPSSIRNLHTLKVPGALKTLALNDGSILSTLEFDGPNQLEMVSMTNCNALTNVINFDMTQIPTVTLNNSYDADELYMSKTTNLSLVNMANIKKLIFLPNNEHETFNLTVLRNSPDYMISAINCPNLKTFMTTAEYRNSYKNGEYGNVKPNIAFCANTLDISNTKITDVNFLCTTDLYQLKLPDTVNNFICDSAYDLDTDYLPDGDFDMVHHEFIEAYTTDYNYNVTKDITETYGYNAMYSLPQLKETVSPYSDNYSDPIDITGVYGIEAYLLEHNNISRFFGYALYDSNMTLIKDVCQTTTNLGYKDVPTTAKWLKFRSRFYENHVDAFVAAVKPFYVFYKKVTPNVITSSSDGSLIFSMYAPTINSAIPAEGIWDLYGLNFKEFYTYGMNNDIKLTDGVLTMPHRYADYNITIQNANITPTNYPTMLYPLLVNENKPVTGIIDYTNYQGDDLSYAMAYANTSEVDIDIPDSIYDSIQYVYNIDINSEYTYVDPKTIVQYKCTSIDKSVKLSDGYSAYKKNETNNGDGTYTVSIIADDLSNLPTFVEFQQIGAALLEVMYINTDNITNMLNMFKGCSNLTSVNTSNWDTTNVFSMGYMFHGCSSLTSLDVGKWNTSKVTNMAYMFYNCSNLTSLDVSKWFTLSVNDMFYMFYGCSSLTSLDVGKWNTSKVATMDCMFYRCSSLTSLDVGNWITSNVTSMDCMFEGCSKLTSIDVSNWNTSNVTTIHKMFRSCASLTSLNASNWDLSKVTNVRWAFSGCSELVDLDISGWDTSNVVGFGGNGGATLSHSPKLKSDKFPVFDFSNAREITRFIENSLAITELHFKNFGPNTTKFNDGYNTGEFIRTDNTASLTTVTGLDLTYMADNENHIKYGIITSPTLVNLTLEGTINNSFRIQADRLSHDSVMNIINALATLNGSVNKTANIGSTNLAKLTNAEIKIATDKGWTLI